MHPDHPSGAKALEFSGRFPARLKPCPFKTTQRFERERAALVRGISPNREQQRKFEVGAPIGMNRPLAFGTLFQAIRKQQNA